MISSLVHRELRGKYKASALGFLWSFINPLLQLLVYTMVFSVIMRNGIENYYMFLFVALIPWIFFSTCVSGGCNCILGQKDLVVKIYFPREVLPVAYTTSQFVNMLLSFIVIFAVLAVSGIGFSIAALAYLPIVFIIEYILSLGFVFMFSALTVYVRDLQNILMILTMAWQFLTPVMYSTEAVPERFRPIFRLNPMTPVIDAYRDILYYKQTPHLGELFVSFVFGAVFLVISVLVFEKLQKRFAEHL